MTITKKYGIKITFDQFKNKVPEDFVDESELTCINKLEEICLKLKSEDNYSYTMIELGSNQAYYSLLFRAIIDGVKNNNKCINVLLEPTPKFMESGKHHFSQNGFDGFFESGCIGHYWCSHINWHDKSIPSYTIDELMSKYNISELDILHSDIDGNEIRLLETSKNAFKDKKIKYIFLLTHGTWSENEQSYKSSIIKNGQDRHEVCKNFLKNCGYNLILESKGGTVGFDGLLVFSKYQPSLPSQ